MDTQTPRPIATGRIVTGSDCGLASPADMAADLGAWHDRGSISRLFGHPIAHWTLLLVLVVMWGSSFAFTKIAVSSISPHSVVAARILIACMALATVAIMPALARCLHEHAFWRDNDESTGGVASRLRRLSALSTRQRQICPRQWPPGRHSRGDYRDRSRLGRDL